MTLADLLKIIKREDIDPELINLTVYNKDSSEYVAVQAAHISHKANETNLIFYVVK